MLSALFFLALTASAQPTLPLYINAGGPQYYDRYYNNWIADTYYTNGVTISTTDAIYNTDTQTIYKTARTGDDFFYTIYDLPVGTYTVTLKFAETQYNAVGYRTFDITLNEIPVKTKFDVYATGGFDTAVDVVAPYINVRGKPLIIKFDKNGGTAFAMVSAIVISQAPTTPAIASFQASPTFLPRGGQTTSTLTWSATGGTSASISYGGTVVPVSPAGGALIVSPAGSTTYTLTIGNATGYDSQGVTVVKDIGDTSGWPDLSALGCGLYGPGIISSRLTW